MTFDVNSLSINKVASMKEGKIDMTDCSQKKYLGPSLTFARYGWRIYSVESHEAFLIGLDIYRISLLHAGFSSIKMIFLDFVTTF